MFIRLVIMIIFKDIVLTVLKNTCLIMIIHQNHRSIFASKLQVVRDSGNYQNVKVFFL